MNYKEKIISLKKMGDKELSKKEVYFLHIPDRGMELEFIQRLKDRWEWLPESYIDFLRTFNGGKYDDISFLGDEGCPDGNIITISNNFQYFDKENMPIAKDSAGDIFCLNKNGSVNWVVLDNVDSYDVGARPIAENFETFMNDFCFGSLYERHYGKNSWTILVTSLTC